MPLRPLNSRLTPRWAREEGRGEAPPLRGVSLSLGSMIPHLLPRRPAGLTQESLASLLPPCRGGGEAPPLRFALAAAHVRASGAQPPLLFTLSLLLPLPQCDKRLSQIPEENASMVVESHPSAMWSGTSLWPGQQSQGERTHCLTSPHPGDPTYVGKFLREET